MIPGFGALGVPEGVSPLVGYGDPGFNMGSLLLPQLLGNSGGDTTALAMQLGSTVPAPAPGADNPALAAAAGQAPAASGGLGSLMGAFSGVQAPAAPKPIFGDAVNAPSLGAANVNVQTPQALSQALKILPGANRAGLPTLGAMIKGAI